MKDSEIFQNLRKDISTFIDLKLELLKLNAYEKSGKIVALLSYGLILLFLAFFAILFIFLALGFFIGEVLDNAAAGFGVITFLYLVIILFVVANKERIRLQIVNAVLATLTANEEKQNTNENGTNKNDTTGEIASK